MAARGFIGSLRGSPVGAWLVLALTVFLPLLALYLLVLKAELETGSTVSHWNDTCTLSLPFKGIVNFSCAKLRIASFLVSAIGAFVVVLLVWWLLNELIGLRRIFEVPWFGVGEDVENVGVIESIVRAGVFVVVVWVALGLCVLAYVGMSGGTVDGKKPTSEPSPRPSVELVPIDKLTAEVKGIRDQLAGRTPSVGSDSGTAPQLQRIGDGLRDIQAVLTSQDRKLDMLRQIDGRLTRWGQEHHDVAILDEAKRLNGAVGEVRTLLDAQGRKLAALDDIERLLRDLDTKQAPGIAGEVSKTIGAVTELQRHAREQTDVLVRIERLMNQRPEGAPPPDPPTRPNETSCFEPAGAAAHKVSIAAAPRRYDRTLLVFFDKSGTQFTPGAGEGLRELAEELRRIDQPAVSIFGSADAQGDPGLSAQYAEQRAQVVKQFLERNVPQLRVQTTSARSSDEPPSEPYNRIARVEAHGICR